MLFYRFLLSFKGRTIFYSKRKHTAVLNPEKTKIEALRIVDGRKHGCTAEGVAAASAVGTTVAVPRACSSLQSPSAAPVSPDKCDYNSREDRRRTSVHYQNITNNERFHKQTGIPSIVSFFKHYKLLDDRTFNRYSNHNCQEALTTDHRTVRA